MSPRKLPAARDVARYDMRKNRKPMLPVFHRGGDATPWPLESGSPWYDCASELRNVGDGSAVFTEQLQEMVVLMTVAVCGARSKR